MNPLAHALADRFGSLSAALSAPMELLTQVDGVGERTAILLHLVPQIAQKARLADLKRDLALNTRERVGDYLLELFSRERNEAVYQVCLDGKGKLLACRRLGEGSASAVNLDVRKIVQNAIVFCACSVILAHNHPSGVALPSQEDHTATLRDILPSAHRVAIPDLIRRLDAWDGQPLKTRMIFCSFFHTLFFHS